jgi:hypothetical protein
MADSVKDKENVNTEEAKQVIEMLSQGYDEINGQLEQYVNMLEEEVGKVGSGTEEE